VDIPSKKENIEELIITIRELVPERDLKAPTLEDFAN